MVGRTEEQLTEEGIPYEAGIAQYKEIARGQLLGDEIGMLKLLSTRRPHAILGVHVIGTGATELIHIGQAVMAFKRHGRVLRQHGLQLPDAGGVLQGRGPERPEQAPKHLLARAGFSRSGRWGSRGPGSHGKAWPAEFTPYWLFLAVATAPPAHRASQRNRRNRRRPRPLLACCLDEIFGQSHAIDAAVGDAVRAPAPRVDLLRPARCREVQRRLLALRRGAARPNRPAVNLSGRLEPDPDSREQRSTRSGMHPDLHIINKELPVQRGQKIRDAKQATIAKDVDETHLLKPAVLAPLHKRPHAPARSSSSMRPSCWTVRPPTRPCKTRS